jgi:hypothetical protein
VPVLFLIAIVVVLVGIFFAATGRGGELSYEPADHAPLDLGPVSAADIALLRPPTAMWGYNMQVTDAALDQIARAMRERDVTIAYLQEQLAGYEHNGPYTEPRGAHARQATDAAEIPGTRETSAIAGFAGPSSPEAPETRETPAIAGAPEIVGIAEFFETPGTHEAPAAPDPSDALQSQEARQSPEDPEDFQPPEDPEAFQPLGNPEAFHPPGNPEALQSPEAREPLETPGALEPLESPEPLAAAEPPATASATATQVPPRTALVLKAPRPKPEPHEATQPSQTLQEPEEAHDATEPSAVLRDDEDSKTTQPSATLARDETPGPQGAFDTHGWWAEQKEAARDEQVHRDASGEQDDDSVATAEEQGW